MTKDFSKSKEAKICAALQHVHHSQSYKFWKISENSHEKFNLIDLSSFWAYLVIEKNDSIKSKNVRTQILIRNVIFLSVILFDEFCHFLWVFMTYYLPYVHTEFHFTELLWCLPLWYSPISQHSLDFNKISKNLIFDFFFQPMGIEGPIFCRQKINYQPRLDITGFSAVGGRIFQIQNHRQLVELDQLQEQRTIDICRSGMVLLSDWLTQ